MATPEQIEAIADVILGVYGGDVAAFTAAQTRDLLTDQLADLESQRRVKIEEANASAEAYSAEVVALTDAINAKQAEIDALAD